MDSAGIHPTKTREDDLLGIPGMSHNPGSGEILPSASKKLCLELRFESKLNPVHTIYIYIYICIYIYILLPCNIRYHDIMDDGVCRCTFIESLYNSMKYLAMLVKTLYHSIRRNCGDLYPVESSYLIWSPSISLKFGQKPWFKPCVGRFILIPSGNQTFRAGKCIIEIGDFPS